MTQNNPEPTAVRWDADGATRFEFASDVEPGGRAITTRATDTVGNTQPSHVPYNEKGHLFNQPLSPPHTSDVGQGRLRSAVSPPSAPLHVQVADAGGVVLYEGLARRYVLPH